MSEKRGPMLAAQLQRVISDVLRSDYSSPTAALCSVLKVEISPDLSHARVFFTVYGTEEQRLAAFTGLKRAEGFFRHQAAGRLKLRKMPDLHFFLDDSIEYSVKISQIINQLHKDEPHA